MVNKLIHWCLRNGFLVFIGVAAIMGGGYYALTHTLADALPDIGEKQVIVFADWPGRSPQDVDDQVTYPLTTSLTGTPGVKTIRSMSGFGFAMVFVIFRDDVDFYWARSRVVERISVAQQRLPKGVVPVIGPDATALGQVYWYTVEGEGFDLAELRSIQDWYLRYQINSVEGVSEVASVGGFVKQYQIDVHPDKLRAHRVTLLDVTTAVQKANIDVGAKVIEKNGIEFFIRGVGFIKSVEDLENVVIRQEAGTPIQVKHVATVTLGPDFRRGALDKGGVEAVGGVVVMRYGENPRAVIDRVKAKLRQLEPGLPQKTLPDGRLSQVRVVPFYDRSDIVNETIDTLQQALVEEMLMAAAVIVIFMLHLRSTVSVLVTLPLSLCLCFILMYVFGVDANIMSLAGLAIAIGDVGDMGIIMTENIYRHVARGDPGQESFPASLRGRQRSGRRYRHGGIQHAGIIHPGVFPHRPGRQAVRAAGIHQDIRHRVQRDPGAHRGAVTLLPAVPPGELAAAHHLVAGRRPGYRRRSCGTSHFRLVRRHRALQRLAHGCCQRRDRGVGNRSHDSRTLPATGTEHCLATGVPGLRTHLALGIDA